MDFQAGDIVKGRIYGWDEARQAQAAGDDGPDGPMLMDVEEYIIGALQVWDDPTNRIRRTFIGQYEVEPGSITAAGG